MNIILIVLMIISLIMCVIVWIGAIDYKYVFYKMGIVVYRRKFKINKNYMKNEIGNKIEKDYSVIKILNENKALFYHHTKNPIEHMLTYKLVPEILFGEINIKNNDVIIDFKLPIFIIPLFLFSVVYLIYENINSLSFTIPIFIFLGVCLGIITIIQIFILGIMKFEMEYYVCNGI